MAKVFNVPQVASRLRLYDQRSRAAMRAGMAAGAQRLEDWERLNRRWEDRSGDARDNLTALVEDTQRGLRIRNMHGVPYGQYLERVRQGYFAILHEAIWVNWPDILRDCGRRVKGVR
jgi:hypothetical protein